MRIGLVVTGLKPLDDGQVSSDHASTRLRALIPAKGLMDRGHQIALVEDVNAASLPLDGIDVLAVHKVRTDLRDLLRRARRRGVAAIVDICDHVFIHPQLSAFYPAMLDAADGITVASSAMGKIVHAHTGRPSRVVPDAIEGSHRPPRSGQGRRLLWFGRSQNIGPLLAALPSLAGVSGASLEIVTDLRAGLADTVGRATPAGIDITLTSWTVAEIDRALSRADLALMPSDTGDGHMVKSSNRLERALWGGCMAAATPTPATTDWADLAYVDWDLARSVERALEDRADWPARIRAAQHRIAETRSPAALAAAWEAAARDAVHCQPSRTSAR